MTNNEIKYFEKLRQKKYRESENKFLIEGIHLIEECLQSELFRNQLEKIIVRDDFNAKSLNTIFINHNCFPELYTIDERTFSKLTETVNSQGVIGIVNKPILNYDIDISKSGLVIVALDNLNDPGNLGTILRTCYWFGVDEVLLSKNSVEIYNSKVIRASQGAIFNLNIKSELDLEIELGKYSGNGMSVYLSDNKAKSVPEIFKNTVKKNIVVVFGNEANGISANILNCKDYQKFGIKGFTKCESLNVSVAVGIVLNEIKNDRN